MMIAARRRELDLLEKLQGEPHLTLAWLGRRCSKGAEVRREKHIGTPARLMRNETRAKVAMNCLASNPVRKLNNERSAPCWPARPRITLLLHVRAEPDAQELGAAGTRV
jgi:hypothetical protein